MTDADSAALVELLDKEAIRALIQETASLLDREDLAGWLALFGADAEYELTAYGPEIRASMTWWKSTRDELAKILEEVPQHVRDAGRRLHLVTPISISIAGGTASAASHFAVLRTDRDGHTDVYATGRYEDEMVRQGDRWRYARHRCVLDTRMLESGTHIPL
jgi:3-phenylpropionate/cinnamic acid dioxygenase small subunit